MVLGPKPMVKPTSWMWKTRFLDRTKALHGPRTQAYGKTNYLDEEPTKKKKKKTMARKPQNPSEEDS